MSDADQAAAEADQDAADRDQRASARDQAAADRDHAHAPPDREADRAYEESRAERRAVSAERESIAAARAETAHARTQRDAVSHAAVEPAAGADAAERDDAARLRDASAVARDQATEAGDRAAEREEASIGGRGVASPTAAVTALRESVATMRARGAADRAGAAADRAGAADDRREARGDLARAQIDGLTGVYTRGPGLMTLEHEIERAHRSGEPFVLAFVDVDGLKKVNDVQGHAAGDELLRAVGVELRSNLRSYDPVVRVGGDEFVCAFSNTGLEAAAGRVGEIQEALSRLGVQSTISVGLAELRPHERLEALCARGDAELYRAKQAS